MILFELFMLELFNKMKTCIVVIINLIDHKNTENYQNEPQLPFFLPKRRGQLTKTIFINDIKK